MIMLVFGAHKPLFLCDMMREAQEKHSWCCEASKLGTRKIHITDHINIRLAPSALSWS